MISNLIRSLIFGFDNQCIINEWLVSVYIQILYGLPMPEVFISVNVCQKQQTTKEEETGEEMLVVSKKKNKNSC